MSGKNNTPSWKGNIEYVETNQWLRKTKSGKALHVEEYRKDRDCQMELFAPIKQVKQLLDGERNRILFNELDKRSDERKFIPTDVAMRVTKSGKAILIGEDVVIDGERDEGPFTIPVSQLNELIEDERENIPLSEIKFE